MEEKQEQTGNHAEYIRLLMSSHVRVVTYIQMLVQKHQDAEDLFQETAAIAWEKFSEYESGSNFAAWAITIARFRILQYWEKNKNSIVHYSDATLKAIEESMVQVAPQASNDLLHLKGCMQKLRDRDAALIRMRYSKKTTIKTMAEELDRSVKGLYSSLSRIHLILAECIQRQRLLEN